MQQALAYTEMMDILFVFSSNGDGFLLHDRFGRAGKKTVRGERCAGERCCRAHPVHGRRWEADRRESLENYTKANVTLQYATISAFLNSCTKAEQKTAILEELEEQVGQDYDPFDLICYVVFGQPPLSRKERVAVQEGVGRCGC